MRGVASIKAELARLEAEDKNLSAELQRVNERQQPLDAKTSAAAAFLSTWSGVGNLLGEVPDEEKQQILQHYVEVIDFRETDASGEVGVYAIQLFPEVRQYFDIDDGDGDTPVPTSPRRKTPSGAAPPVEGSPAALTSEDAVVCTSVRLAPRGGLNSIQGLLSEEPCSTIGYVERPSSPSSLGAFLSPGNRHLRPYPKGVAIR